MAMPHDQMNTAAYKQFDQDPTRQPTSIGIVDTAMEEARSLAFRVSDLVDRLCGMQPQAVPAAGTMAGPSSLLGGLRADADRTSDAVRHAMAQLNRLDRELP